MSQIAVVRDYRALETGRRRANRLGLWGLDRLNPHAKGESMKTMSDTARSDGEDSSRGHRREPEEISVGRARDSFAPIGSNLSDYDNYFCRDCRHIVQVRKGSPRFRACPTQGCTRPTGFGVYAKVLRPVRERRPSSRV
jgi:hypothetical protein